MPCAFHCVRNAPFNELEPGCQFEPAEQDLVEFTGKAWCSYHLPLTDEDGNKSPKAHWDDGTINKFNEAVISLVKQFNWKSKITDFTGVVFPGEISFKTFRAKNPFLAISFHKAIFSGNTNFRNVVFSGNADFQGVKFDRDVTFNKADFQKKANFRESKFCCEGPRGINSASFRSASFRGHLDFHSAVFWSHVYFTTAGFHSRASFVETSFYGHSEFNGNLGITDALEGAFQQIDFANVRFWDLADFSDRSFLKTANFSNTYFTLAPKFHNCEFHQDTDFTGAQFPDTTSRHSAPAYRTLKLAMEKHRAWDETAMFYAHEQRSIRHQQETSISVKVFSFLYDYASNYGRSFIWPIVWLAVFIVLFHSVYAIWANYISGGVIPSDAFTFTMEQITRPFSVWSSAYKPSGGIKVIWDQSPLWLRWVATVQSLLSLGLITLFLLALRRRFKMG